MVERITIRALKYQDKQERIENELHIKCRQLNSLPETE